MRRAGDRFVNANAAMRAVHRGLFHAALLRSKPGWSDLPAVKDGRVYAVDANAYFARPGPRLVEGIELLAHLIHPDRFAWKGATDAYAVVRDTAATPAAYAEKASTNLPPGARVPRGSQ
jgi:hypothetical protein